MATYETLKRLKTRGPSMVVEFCSDQGIADVGRTLVRSLGTRGLVCIDIIRDSNDVNLRMFGTFSACQSFGFDFSNAYLNCLRGGGDTKWSQLNSEGAKSFVFPFGLFEVFRSDRRGLAPLRAIKWIWNYWRLPGSRYLLSLAIGGLFFSFQWTRERRVIGRSAKMVR